MLLAKSYTSLMSRFSVASAVYCDDCSDGIAMVIKRAIKG